MALLRVPSNSGDNLRRENSFGKIHGRLIASKPFAPEYDDIASYFRDADWWKKTIIYQLYPRSFQDSNGDGVGDLRGIISRLDYFTYLQIGCIWINPIYRSPMRDCGYDVADFFDIDPTFGTLADFDELIAGLHERGIKLLMDFIPNHTSDENEWFKKSKASKADDNPYRDFYVWHDGVLDQSTGKRVPPNNWLSLFGGTMWEWCEERQQFYLHQFLSSMPDLNYRCPAVVEAMESVLKFWLHRGVDGFRVDAVKHLFEAENVFQNEEPSGRSDVSSDQYESLRHRHTIDQEEIGDVIAGWRNVIDEFGRKTHHYRFMVAEVYEDCDTTIDDVMEYYTNGCDAPFNFQLVSNFTPHSGGHGVRAIVERWLSKMPCSRRRRTESVSRDVGGGLGPLGLSDKWPVWTLGNHDSPRIADKFGASFVNALNMLVLLLPGTPVTYYGEELGLPGQRVSFEETQDTYCKRFGPDRYHLLSRDPARGPMLWDGSKNAGFSDVKPWLPVLKDFESYSVDFQMNNKEATPLKLYRDLAILRQQPAFQCGNFRSCLTTENLYCFIRGEGPAACFAVGDNEFSGTCYCVILNMGKNIDYIEDPTIDLFGYPEQSNAKIVLHTNNIQNEQRPALAAFPDKPFPVYPGQGFVIQSSPAVHPYY